MNLNKHPKCELGHPYVVRINRSSNQKFWGCVFYPEHISTIQIPYCSNNHPMIMKESSYGEYFTCRNGECSSSTYDFEPKNSKYHAQLINLFFRSKPSYSEFKITETISDDEDIEDDDYIDLTWKQRRDREIKTALDKINEKERSDNFISHGVRETNLERINRVLTDYEIAYKPILNNLNNEFIEVFNNLWNNPFERSRFVKVKPENLIDFLEVMKPKKIKKGSLNSFMPWNRGY